MVSITQKIEPLTFEVRGYSFKINTNFRNAIKALNHLPDSPIKFFNELGIDIEEITEMLFYEEDYTEKMLNKFVEDFYIFIVKNIYLQDEADTKRPREQMICFEQDAKDISASFYTAYKIDLLEIDFLDYRKFIAFLNGLSNTSINEIWKIRSMEIPEPNKHNEKHRQSVIEAKEAAKIKPKYKEEKNDLNQKLAHLFK